MGVSAAAAAEVTWHDIECGSYSADLPLWRELADAAADPPGSAPVLEIGAGTGRVALDLARRGHSVTAVDIEPALLGALRERAEGLDVETVRTDARALKLPRRDYALCLLPMQTLQLLGGPEGRSAFLAGARTHLRPGALVCCAIVTAPEEFDSSVGSSPTAESARIDGRLYVSLPTRVAVTRRRITIERERTVTPADHPQPEHNTITLDRLGPSVLEREGQDAGLIAAGTAEIAATEEHVGSTVVMLRV
jgi:SAM-dependent methyltransferase